jgi:hypothetical protein
MKVFPLAGPTVIVPLRALARANSEGDTGGFAPTEKGVHPLRIFRQFQAECCRYGFAGCISCTYFCVISTLSIQFTVSRTSSFKSSMSLSSHFRV